MKIRTRLSLISYISLAVMLIMICFLIWSFIEVSKTDYDLQLVQKIRNNIVDRITLKDEYLLNHEQRGLIQWDMKNEELRNLLELASGKLTHRDAQMFIKEAKKNFEGTLSIFHQIVKIHQRENESGKYKALSIELERKLCNQLLLKAYGLRNAINSLGELSRKKSQAQYNRIVIFIAIFVTVAFLTTVIMSMAVTRILRQRIEQIIQGIKIIGAGNLDYRLDVKGDDELSDLARLNNEMVVKLQISFTSIENLQREITERQQAEAEVLRQSTLIEVINHILIETLRCDTDKEVALTSLKAIQELTGSKFGWIGEVNSSGRLDTLALSDPGWHSCKIAETQRVATIRNMEIRGIWSKVLKDGESLITNDPSTHPDRVGVPSGHPELTAFIGVPLKQTDKTIGMIAVANKPSGYDRYDQEAIETISVALIEALRRKRAEDEIRTLNQELEQRVQERTAQLEATNRELEAFSYSVSHDLRAPLRGIDGWSLAFLEDYGDGLDKQGRNYLDWVRAETQRMGQLIDDMLSLSRVGRAEMRREPVDLTALVQGITDKLRKTQPERQAEFSIQPGLAATGDFRLLEMALVNLLENAWKFTGKEPAARIEFGQIAQDDQSVFFLRDNGTGFDMAYASNLFGAFQRLHQDSEFPGTGIGLATVQRIIKRHGGRIWAEAAVDQGATFYFTL